MRIYKKSASLDKFIIPLYRRPIFYIVGLIIVSSLVLLPILIFNYYNIFLILTLILCLILLIILVGYSITQFLISLKYHGRYYRASYNIKQNIILGLLDTMTLNSPKVLNKVKVPYVFVDLTNIKKTGQAIVKIERLAGMNNIEDLSLIVSNAFKYKYGSYAVTGFKENDNILEYNFILEDVELDRTLHFNNMQEFEDILIDDPYKILIQDGVILDLSVNPMILIGGKTGSGKSSYLRFLLLSLIHKADITILDPKKEFSNFAFMKDRVYSDPQAILNRVVELTELLKERSEQMSKLVAKSGQMGAVAKDFGLKPIVIICEEYLAVQTMLDKKKELPIFQDCMRQLLTLSRFAGFSVIVLSQVVNADVIDTKQRSQFSAKFLLWNSSREQIQMMFGDNNETVKTTVDRFKGYYHIEGQTQQPKLLHLANIKAIDNIENFKKQYEKGKHNDKER